jgi:hypothetical protein
MLDMLRQQTHGEALPNLQAQESAFFCMSIKLKNNKGEEITRMFDTQWILHIMEATHIDTLVNRVQEPPSSILGEVGQWNG